MRFLPKNDGLNNYKMLFCFKLGFLAFRASDLILLYLYTLKYEKKIHVCDKD